MMDPRVKPAGDEPAAGVIAGLDPAIHPLVRVRFALREDDGPAGQARG